MSRTDKTRPFWVKVQDHGIEHHDHSQFGEEIWRDRPVLDEDGKRVMETVPHYSRADEYLSERSATRTFYIATPLHRDEDGRRIFFFNVTTLEKARKQHEIRLDADRAIREGDPKRLIETGTYTRVKRERYLAYTMADHCTIDDKRSETRSWGGRDQPCYMEGDWYGANRAIFKYRCSCCHPRPEYSAQRSMTRDALNTLAKGYNSGEDDWEGAADRYDLTPKRKTTKSWW